MWNPTSDIFAVQYTSTFPVISTQIVIVLQDWYPSFYVKTATSISSAAVLLSSSSRHNSCISLTSKNKAGRDSGCGFSHLLYYTVISYFCEYGIHLISYGSSSMAIITGFSWKKRTCSLTSWTNSKSNFSSVYNSFECSFFHSFISSLLFFIYFLPHRCPQWGHSYCFFS